MGKVEKKYGIDITPIDVGKRRLMWGGIIFFVIVIGSLWVWSMYVQVTNISIKNSPEGDMFEKSKQEWQAIFSKQPTSIVNQLQQTSTTTMTTSTLDKKIDYLSTSTNDIKKILEQIISTSTVTTTKSVTSTITSST